MGWFGSVCSAIGSACSTVGGAISSACSSVFGGVSRMVGSVGGLAGLASAFTSALSVVGQVAAIVNAVSEIGKAFGLWGQDDNLEQFGDRVYQAQEQGINPEHFKSYDEYIAKINSIELDPVRSTQISQSEKVMAGLGAAYWGMDSKFGKDAGMLLTAAVRDPDFFNSQRLTSYLEGVRSVGDVARYFANKLEGSERSAVRDELISLEKKHAPERSENDIYRDLSSHIDKSAE